jgi:hypothetical protein
MDNYEQALLKPPSFVRDEDMQVFRLLRETTRKGGGYSRPLLHGPEGWPCSKPPAHRPHLPGAGRQRPHPPAGRRPDAPAGSNGNPAPAA